MNEEKKRKLKGIPLYKTKKEFNQLITFDSAGFAVYR